MLSYSIGDDRPVATIQDISQAQLLPIPAFDMGNVTGPPRIDGFNRNFSRMLPCLRSFLPFLDQQSF